MPVVHGLVKFVPALADHFCTNLPAAFTQPGVNLLAEPCTSPSIHTSVLLLLRRETALSNGAMT